MSDTNAIRAKAAAIDKFMTEYASEVNRYEEELSSLVNNMFSDINAMFGYWDGELATQFRKKIEDTLAEVEDGCNDAGRLSEILIKRAQQMRGMLDILNKAGS